MSECWRGVFPRGVVDVLPDFPKLKERLIRLALFDFRSRVNADDLTGGIRTVRSFEGRQFQTGDVEGHFETSSPKLVEIPFSVERQAIIERGIEAFVESARGIVEPMQLEQHRMLFEKMTEVTQRTGNAIDARGQPMSADLFFQALATVNIDFDNDGQPELSGMRLVASPALAERLNRLIPEWKKDPEFQRRYNEVMTIKRDEWRDRESNRKLVD